MRMTMTMRIGEKATLGTGYAAIARALIVAFCEGDDIQIIIERAIRANVLKKVMDIAYPYIVACTMYGELSLAADGSTTDCAFPLTDNQFYNTLLRLNDKYQAEEGGA